MALLTTAAGHGPSCISRCRDLKALNLRSIYGASPTCTFRSRQGPSCLPMSDTRVPMGASPEEPGPQQWTSPIVSRQDSCRRDHPWARPTADVCRTDCPPASLSRWPLLRGNNCLGFPFCSILLWYSNPRQDRLGPGMVRAEGGAAEPGRMGPDGTTAIVRRRHGFFRLGTSDGP